MTSADEAMSAGELASDPSAGAAPDLAASAADEPAASAPKAKGGAASGEAAKPDEGAEAGDKPAHDYRWYVLKVQVNREESIRQAILRRIKIAGLEEFIGELSVPTEKVTEIKGGKKRVMERKFFPGYVMAFLELNDDVWFTIRETAGVGDFVGSGGKPVPMTETDVARMLGKKEEVEHAAPKLKISFQKGDRVKIKEGTFENFEGDVDEVIEAKGLVRVMIQIFGRPTPVELEYWQVEPV